MLCDVDVYQGSVNRIRAKSELGLSGDVVMKLAFTLPEGQNYKIYADNYFTCVPLVVKLLDHGIHYVSESALPLTCCCGNHPIIQSHSLLCHTPH